MTDDDPLTKIHNADALSTNEAKEDTGIGLGSSRARSKDQSLRSLTFVSMCSRRVSQYLSVHERTFPQGATVSMEVLHRDCITARIRYCRTLDIGRQPQQWMWDAKRLK